AGGAQPAQARRARRVSRGRDLRAAPGARGIRGVDHRAEEHALRRLLSGRGAGLAAFRGAAAASDMAAGAASLRARPLQQDRDRDAARRASAGALVAPWTTVVAARRRAAPPVLRARRGGRSVHHLGGAAPRRRRRRGVRSQRRAAGPDRRPRRLVLSRQARVACRPRLHLSALERRSGRPLAIPLPGGGTRSRRGTVGAAQTLSRRAHRGALLSWYAVSRPRLLRRLPVPLLVRRRSLPVPS